MFGVDEVNSLPNAASADRFVPVDDASTLDCELSLLLVVTQATSSFGTVDTGFLRIDTGGETISFGLLGTTETSSSRRVELFRAEVSPDMSAEWLLLSCRRTDNGDGNVSVDLGARRGSVGAVEELIATGVCGIPYGK